MQGNYTTDSDGNVRLMNLDAPAAYILCSAPVEESAAPARLGKAIYGYPPSVFRELRISPLQARFLFLPASKSRLKSR